MSTDAASGAMAGRGKRTAEPSSAAPPNGSRFHDLGLRILSAAVLAPAGIAAAWFGGPWFAAATGAAVVAMSYEWARMSEPGALRPAFLLLLAGALGAVLFSARGMLGEGLAWAALCALVSAVRRNTWSARAETILGAIYISAPCALFLWLRQFPDGLPLIFFLFAVVWTTDVFAYLGGVTIGGPKLHPQLSPQKTWSGIAAGTLAGASAGGVFALLIEAPSVALCVAAGAVLALTGLGGDLFESFLKRRFNVKDASGLIPGHGGVLDRIDGLMAATFITAAAIALAPGLPDALLGSP